jgi:sulfatase maturation enzyme AslB (radical SAM superfamily)
MSAQTFSLILLPTLQCNADCDYCFEDKTDDRLSLARLEILIDKVLDYLVLKAIGTLTIHWQGGEVMTLPPTWFDAAHRLIGTAAANRGVVVTHSLQTNMVGYGPRWNEVIREMFDNQVGTSVDYPNLYRHRHGKDAADYDRILTENIGQARAAGIEVRAIAVPNAQTLAIGAERFYDHFVDTLAIRSFQVNTPFPGGSPNAAKRDLSLDSAALTRFFVDLAEVWLARGDRDGVRVGPFDELLSVFLDAPSVLPCIWTDDCANHILCIDARGERRPVRLLGGELPGLLVRQPLRCRQSRHPARRESGTRAFPPASDGPGRARLHRLRLSGPLSWRLPGADLLGARHPVRERPPLRALSIPVRTNGRCRRAPCPRL